LKEMGCIRVTLVVNKSFILETVPLFDTDADLNCIQEGLILTKFFKKTKEVGYTEASPLGEKGTLG
jgi:hypothetical protein